MKGKKVYKIEFDEEELKNLVVILKSLEFTGVLQENIDFVESNRNKFIYVFEETLKK